MAKIKISLALQGGGAHGAFTWGVLDRLLDDSGIEVEGLSGTSAGAMNAAALALGLIEGGVPGAKAGLARFWRRISELGVTVQNPYQTNPFQNLTRAWNIDWAPTSLWLDMMAQFVSPYQLNPLDRNPLRDFLADSFDFTGLRGQDRVRLYVCATNLQTNQMTIFDNETVSIEAVLASACLPQFHRAVEVEGAYYWDGGFVGNPVLKPLIRGCGNSDIVIVQINPIRKDQIPISARDITDRLNEVTMNAALMRELDTIETFSELVRAGTLTDPRYRDIRLHRIFDAEVMSGLGVRSKNNTTWAFLTYLRDAGRNACDVWLKANRRKLGKQSTLDINQLDG